MCLSLMREEFIWFLDWFGRWDVRIWYCDRILMTGNAGIQGGNDNEIALAFGID